MCVAGEPVECLGPHCTGMQTCLPDGTEGPCVCPTTTGTTGGGTTGSTGTTGGQTSGGGTGSTGGRTSGGKGSSGTTTGVSFIGTFCTMQSQCPDSQYCLATSDTSGFCTLSCGEGALEPPDGGEQLCAATPALGGTPACPEEGDLFTTNSDGGYTFYCELLCGILGDVNEGTCPPELTCTENICQ